MSRRHREGCDRDSRAWRQCRVSSFVEPLAGAPPCFFVDIGEQAFKLAIEHSVQSCEAAFGAEGFLVKRFTVDDQFLHELFADTAQPGPLRLTPCSATLDRA